MNTLGEFAQLWKVKILPKYSLGCLYLCERLFCTALEGGNSPKVFTWMPVSLWKVILHSFGRWKFSQSIHLNACISVEGYSAQLWKVEILPKYSLECLYLCERLFSPSKAVQNNLSQRYRHSSEYFGRICTALEGGNSPKVFTWMPVSLWKVILHSFGRWKFSQSIHLNACISVKGYSAQLWKVLSSAVNHRASHYCMDSHGTGCNITWLKAVINNHMMWKSIS